MEMSDAFRGRRTPATRSSGRLLQGRICMRPDGSGVKRLTHARAETPAWSPDGRYIAFSAPGGLGVMRRMVRASPSYRSREWGRRPSPMAVRWWSSPPPPWASQVRRSRTSGGGRESNQPGSSRPYTVLATCGGLTGPVDHGPLLGAYLGLWTNVDNIRYVQPCLRAS
jgi:WD40-like Beta Propeller Repeat